MGFPAQLVQIGKSQGLTQQGLAEATTLHINQVRRYEAGTAQPTLEGLVKLARALHVSLDELVFADGERGPDDERMKRLFEACERLSEPEQRVIRELLEGMIVKYEARRWTQSA